jgi:hypothetical protein
MCEHLTFLENELKSKVLKETYRGQPWSDNCREWVYYDCVLDVEKLKLRYNFASCVTISRNDDQRSGRELGFYCEQCHDAVMGLHQEDGAGKVYVE